MPRKGITTKLKTSTDKPYKLIPAMVPRPLWGRSVYNELRKTKRRNAWDALRRTVLDTAANTCARCSAHYDSYMVCNEIWHYDDKAHIATLKAFEIVCRDCDSVLHFGKSLVIGGKRGDEGTVDRADQAVKQLMKVNGITKGQAMKLIDDAFGKWMDRSEHDTWAIQIAPELIGKHPVLTDLEL
jgi:hypothetical protein